MTTPTSTKAEIDQALPELPKPKRFFGHSTMMPMWCTEEMRAYATEAIAAERAEVERLRAALRDLLGGVGECLTSQGVRVIDCPVGLAARQVLYPDAALATPTKGGEQS